MRLVLKMHSLLQISMDTNVKLLDSGKALLDPEVYRRLIGTLIYLSVTKLDICYSVQLLSQFMNNPIIDHMLATIHAVRYLKKSPGQGLLHSSSTQLTLTAYCDSNWARFPLGRKSTSG